VWRVANVADYGSATVDGPDTLQDGGKDPEGEGRLQVLRPLVVIPPDIDYGAVVDLTDAEHIAFHNPERVLRKVEATRRLIHDFLVADERGQQDGGQVFGYHATGMLKAIKYEATEYDDQPGYQEKWRP
jgi:hypothetical protein